MNKKYQDKIDKAKIKSIAKALTIIDHMSNKDQCLSLKDIHEQLDIPKSTALGILQTLEQYNYITKLDNNRYELGSYLFEIGNKVRKKIKLDVVAGPHLQKLADELEDTVNLGILKDSKVLLIDKYKASYGFQIGAQIGTKLEPHCIALGKVLMSHLTENEVEKIVETTGMPAKTPNTIVDLNKLKLELKTVYKNGYAIDDEELMTDMRCLAAPLFNNKGENIAAISVSSLVSKLSGERLEKAKNKIIEYAKAISEELGYNAD